MNRMRKFWFGLAIGLPYLAGALALGWQALALGRDLTATGLMIGAIATGVCGVMGLFIYGNAKEGQAK